MLRCVFLATDCRTRPTRSTHLVNSPIVANDACQHRGHIRGVGQSHQLIAMKRQRNNLDVVNHSVEEPIKVVALVCERAINVLGPIPSHAQTQAPVTMAGDGTQVW